jgi:hypothetical protein
MAMLMKHFGMSDIEPVYFIRFWDFISSDIGSNRGAGNASD